MSDACSHASHEPQRPHCLAGLTPRAEAVVEASGSEGRRRATEQGSRRALGRTLRLSARLALGRRIGDESNGSFGIRRLLCEFAWMGARPCHRGMLRLGGRGLGLRRECLDRRCVLRQRDLILGLRSEQIAYEATDAAGVSR